MSIWRRLYHDQDGGIIASELVLIVTLLFCATIIGVFVVRTAIVYVFMGVAVDISGGQSHDFDTADQGDLVGSDGLLDNITDSNANGFVGYMGRTTTDFVTSFPTMTPEAEPTPDELDFDDTHPGGG